MSGQLQVNGTVQPGEPYCYIRNAVGCDLATLSYSIILPLEIGDDLEWTVGQFSSVSAYQALVDDNRSVITVKRIG